MLLIIPLQPDGAIAYADAYARTNAGRWSYDLHFAYTNHRPYFNFASDCNNTCDSYLAALGYCIENTTLLDCCVVAAVEKYKTELWLQVVAGQQNNSAGLNNTNDLQLKVKLALMCVVTNMIAALTTGASRGRSSSTSTRGSQFDLERQRLLYPVVWQYHMYRKRLLRSLPTA